MVGMVLVALVSLDATISEAVLGNAHQVMAAVKTRFAGHGLERQCLSSGRWRGALLRQGARPGQHFHPFLYVRKERLSATACVRLSLMAGAEMQLEDAARCLQHSILDMHARHTCFVCGRTNF